MPIIDVSTAQVRVQGLARVYGLLFLAIVFTALGCAVGATVALPLMTSGWIVLLFILELAIVWTAPSWTRSSPLKYILFAAFPFLSGLTLTPVIINVLV